MKGLLLALVGLPTALAGAIMCLAVLNTGEGNPLTALGVLALGIVLSVPGWREAQRNWTGQ